MRGMLILGNYFVAIGSTCDKWTRIRKDVVGQSASVCYLLFAILVFSTTIV